MKKAKITVETLVLHLVINILNRVLNTFEQFLYYTKSITTLPCGRLLVSKRTL